MAGATALRDFGPTYVADGSIAPDRHDRNARPMSASPPIAVKHWHRSETPLCAKSGCEQPQQRSVWGAHPGAGGGLSDAEGQRVHRQEDKCQDEHAADRGPDPGFHGRVHDGVAAIQCGISFRGHELRLITLSDLYERYARTMASAAVMAITKRAISGKLVVDVVN